MAGRSTPRSTCPPKPSSTAARRFRAASRRSVSGLTRLADYRAAHPELAAELLQLIFERRIPALPAGR